MTSLLRAILWAMRSNGDHGGGAGNRGSGGSGSIAGGGGVPTAAGISWARHKEMR